MKGTEHILKKWYVPCWLQWNGSEYSPVRRSVPHKAENILASCLTIRFSIRTLLNKRGHSVTTLSRYFVQDLQYLNLFTIVHIGGPTITHSITSKRQLKPIKTVVNIRMDSCIKNTYWNNFVIMIHGRTCRQFLRFNTLHEIYILNHQTVENFKVSGILNNCSFYVIIKKNTRILSDSFIP